MAATTVPVERTGPAIRAALATHAPADELRFVAELRAALADAGQDLDLAGPQAVVRRWPARAVMAANPLSADELTQLEAVRAGDFTGLSLRDEHGAWTTL